MIGRNVLVALCALSTSLAATMVQAPLPASALQTSYAATPNLPIPDNAYDGSLGSMGQSTIEVPLTGHTVSAVSLVLQIDHTWVGDLTVKLRSPSGTILTLVDRPRGDNTNVPGDTGTGGGGDSSDLNSGAALLFSDSSPEDPEDMGKGIPGDQVVCVQDFRCQFKPNRDSASGPTGFAAAFKGQQAGGDWTLFVGDSTEFDTGTLAAWSITIRHTQSLHSCVTAPFSDVATSDQFCPEIQWMKENLISTGFNDETYRPGDVVTRQAMSAFMARVASAEPSPCATPPFPDVPIDHPFCPEIQWMADEGISTGFGDGNYKPDLAVTRQAMSAFMLRLTKLSPPPCTTPPFTDVPTDHPFCTEIKWMKATAISTGFSDDTFRPSVAVTRQAMSAFMYRVSALLP
jgi:subtilisin-like proprotein convertase family protein